MLSRRTGGLHARLAVAGIAVAAATIGCSGDRTSAGPVRGVSTADYDRWRQPDRVIAALALSDGDVVADIGAGRGYFTHRLARAVGPRGQVIATDIDAVALMAVSAAPPEPGAAPIRTRLVAPNAPGLEAGGYDRVLLAQVDHLLADRVDYLRRLRRALAPDGRIVVQNRLPHRQGLLDAAGAAGFTVRALTELPGQYVAVLDPNPEPSP